MQDPKDRPIIHSPLDAVPHPGEHTLVLGVDPAGLGEGSTPVGPREESGLALGEDGAVAPALEAVAQEAEEDDVGDDEAEDDEDDEGAVVADEVVQVCMWRKRCGEGAI